MLDLVDKVKPVKGRVRIWVEEFCPETGLSTGPAQMVFEDPNLIVDTARKALAHLVASSDSAYQLATFQLGTEGNVPGDILTPVAPTVGDTALADGSPFSKALSTFVYLPSGVETSVKYTVPIEKTEANDPSGAAKAYTEAGLVTTNGTLFARETFPAVVKTSARKITFEWSLLF